MKKILYVPLTSFFLVLALILNVVFLNSAPQTVLQSSGNVAESGKSDADVTTLSDAEENNEDIVYETSDSAESTSTKNTSSGSGETAYAHGTTVSTDDEGNKVFKFSYNGKTYNSEFDRLMAEDGFIYGIDWDWFGLWTTNVNALGDDQVYGYKSRYRPAYVERALYNMHAMGNNAMGTWLGPKTCFKFDLTTGLVVGLDPKFEENLINLLESCRKTGMDLVPALLSHGDGGHYFSESALDKESSEMFDFLIRFYYEGEAQDAYFKNWVEPVCEILSRYQDVIPIVALTIENGTEINDIETGEMYYSRGVTWDVFASLNNRLHDTVKKYMPNVLTSVEDVGNPSYMFKYNDLKVDIISPQKYESDGTFPDNAQWMKTRAGYLGEFNYAHGGDYMDISLDALDLIMQKFYKDARQKGYLGAFHFIWSYQDPSRWSYFLTGNSDKYDSLRNFAVPVSYIINDLKNEHRGITDKKDAPSLFYNNESTTTYWIGCRNAESYILERSDNGGKWKVIAKDIDPVDNSLTNGLVTYNDETLPTTGDYRYRVAAVYEDGEKVYSDAGNVTRCYVPVEKLLDSNGTYVGDFEKGDAIFSSEKASIAFDKNFDAFKWLSNGKIGKIIDGGKTGKCLYGNTADGTSAAAGYSAQWIYNLNVTPNADHELSFYLKKGSTGRICFAIRPVVDGEHLEQVGYIHSSLGAEETEEEWVRNFFTFTAPDSGQIAVYTRISGDGEFWVDDLSVKEIR